MKCHLFFSFIFKVYVVSLYTFEKLLFPKIHQEPVHISINPSFLGHLALVCPTSLQ